jgi:hypothetical protein
MEFADVVKESLSWKRPFCRTLSYASQRAILQEIHQLTQEYRVRHASSLETLAHTFHQLKVFRDLLDEKQQSIPGANRRGKRSEEEDHERESDEEAHDLALTPVATTQTTETTETTTPSMETTPTTEETDVEFPPKWKRVQQKAWDKIPESLQRNLLESGIFKETQMGGEQRAVVQLSFYTGKKRKRQTPNDNPFCISEEERNIFDQLIVNETDYRYYSPLVKHHTELIKDWIRQLVEKKAFEKVYPSSLQLKVRKPRSVAPHSMFTWQKQGWRDASSVQKDVIMERLSGSFSSEDVAKKTVKKPRKRVS